MKLFISKKRSNISATAEYDADSGMITVKKGSVVSEKVSHSEKFRSAKTIEKKRKDIVDKDNKLLKDITFKSTSSAANFVTGVSTNGLTTWRDKDGKTLKEIRN